MCSTWDFLTRNCLIEVWFRWFILGDARNHQLIICNKKRMTYEWILGVMCKVILTLQSFQTNAWRIFLWIIVLFLKLFGKEETERVTYSITK